MTDVIFLANISKEIDKSSNFWVSGSLISAAWEQTLSADGGKNKQSAEWKKFERIRDRWKDFVSWPDGVTTDSNVERKRAWSLTLHLNPAWRYNGEL